MATVTSQHSTRINARLDTKHAAKLELLKTVTGWTASDIVKRGIDLVHDEVQKTTRHPLEVLSAAGFIGSFEGPEDFSDVDKEALTQYLESKHGPR